MLRAPSGSDTVRALMEFRLLNRKCGSIWARSAFSSASRARTCSSRARFPAARDSSSEINR